MVYVNNKKFACESCIKGHRSSSCHHTDRPLFEIKKKGRPVSQCPKCRELRQSKKLHSKCTCNHKDEASQPTQPVSSSSKQRRFIPIVPALPNGLRDVLSTSKSSVTLPPDSRQRVSSLLNPCDCKSVWKCKCKNLGSAVPVPEAVDGLATLAQAADLHCCSPSFKSPIRPLSANALGKKAKHSHPANLESPVPQSNKRPKCNHIPGPDLAPIIHTPSSTPKLPPIPDFGFMPPMSEITSFAGSGCTCGVLCACPGCVEHSTEHDGRDLKDCADGCGMCIDGSSEIALVDQSGSQGTSFLDRFFARAATLPPPPPHRKLASYYIDPLDTSVYGGERFPFGVVNLPKLECCGGQCSCSGGQCTCQASCGGRCTDSSAVEQTATPSALHTVLPTSHAPPPRSCCTRIPEA